MGEMYSRRVTPGVGGATCQGGRRIATCSAVSVSFGHEQGARVQGARPQKWSLGPPDLMRHRNRFPR